MIDYLGLIISGLSTYFFSTKDPWERKLKLIKVPYGTAGVILLIAGIIISIITTCINDIEKTEYKNQLNNIDINVKNTLNSTSHGFEELLNKYEFKTNQLLVHFSNNYDTLMETIINKNDSALYAQLKKMKDEYKILDSNYTIEKSITQRYYYAEQWPWSDNKRKDISSVMFFFIPGDIAGLVNGTDRYIIWYLIENNGSFSYNKINEIQEDIWYKLKPISLSIGTNLKQLELLKIIKPEYWEGKIEFTDYFMKRLNVYKEFKKDKNEDTFIKNLYKLQLNNYYNIKEDK